MPSAATALKRISIFMELEAAAVEAVGRHCRWREYAAGQTILSHKDESTDVFFILDGKVTATVYSPNGKQVVFRDIERGEMFGEFSAIDQRPRSATVVAAADCLIASMGAEDFWEILNAYPGVAAKTLRKLTAQLRALTDRVYEVSALAVRNRIHAELLRMAQDDLAEDGSATISPVPTHTDIAKAMAMRAPWSLASTPKVVMLVAGPVNKNASTAPGDMPWNSSIAASGVLPVAQT